MRDPETSSGLQIERLGIKWASSRYHSPPIPSFVVCLASFIRQSQPTLQYKLRQVYLGVGGRFLAWQSRRRRKRNENKQ